jgi:hypothetical protein
MSDSLTLEKARVVERLTTLETKFDIFIEKFEENNEKMNHIILGNGKKGLAEEVRNLKEVHDKHKLYANSAWLAIIGLAVTTAWTRITGK